MLDYYLILLIVFTGLIVGWLLARLAWEEIEMYEVFLKGLQVACVAAAAALAAFSGELELSIAVLVVYSIFYFTNRYKGAYAVLPVFFWLSYPTEYFPYVAGALFLYGFPTGSFAVHEEGENAADFNGLLQILQSHYWFLVVGVILAIAL